MFDELYKTPFRPRKQKQGHEVEVEDCGLLRFAAFEDLPVSFQEGEEEQVFLLDIQDLCVVPKRETRDSNIEDVHDVGMEDEVERSEDEDLDLASEGASSSSSDLRTHMAPPTPVTAAKSSNSNACAQRLVFRYDADEAVFHTRDKQQNDGMLSPHPWSRITKVHRNHRIIAALGGWVGHPTCGTWAGGWDSQSNM